jgi:hypothetical protein
MSSRSLGLSCPLLFILPLLFVNVARAHDLEARYLVLPEGRVRIESFFETGDAPPRASVKVQRPDESVLCEGRLDKHGFYFFPWTQPEDLRVVVRDRTGHRAEVRIAAKELIRATACDALVLLAPPPTALSTLSLLAARSALGLPDEEAPLRPADRGHGPAWGKLLLGVGILLGLGALALLRKARSR